MCVFQVSFCVFGDVSIYILVAVEFIKLGIHIIRKFRTSIDLYDEGMLGNFLQLFRAYYFLYFYDFHEAVMIFKELGFLDFSVS